MTDGQNEVCAVDEEDNQGNRMLEIELDWEALAVAFENQLAESHSFLELSSGTVHTISGTMTMPEPPEPTENYLYIHPRPSREGYRTMQAFIEKVSDTVLRDRLAAALVGKGAFRRFKDQLLAYPEERLQWFAFKDAEVYAYVRDWLEAEGVQATNEPPETTSKEKLPAPRPHFFETRRDMLSSITPSEEEVDFRQAIVPHDRADVNFRPRRAALLVIDMQRVFVDPEGTSFFASSVPVSERLTIMIDACRKARIPVLFTRHLHQYPEKDGGAMSRWWRSLIEAGAEEAALVDTIVPNEGEPVIAKCRYDAFVGTNLEMILRSMGIEDLIIGGVMTNLCCETTAREAFVKDFNVFFLGDGTASPDMSLHLASLKNIAYGFGRVLGVTDALNTIESDATVSSS